MKYQIKTMDDLDEAIIHLKSIERVQYDALSTRLSDPAEVFSMFKKFVSRFGTNEDLLEKLLIHPLTAFLSRMGLPVLINKTLLKDKNIFVKGLVVLLSQKVSGLTKQLFNAALDELVNLFQGKPNKLDNHYEMNKD